MTLEGQQSSIVNIDNRKFQVLVHDTAGKKLINPFRFFIFNM